MKAILLVAVLTAGGWSWACAPKGTTFETPKAQLAYQVDQVLQRVGTLQTTVINLEASGTLPTDQARIILKVCRVADIALPAVPSGWKTSAVLAAWETARGELPTIGDLPATWQDAVKRLWTALKARVPLLTGPGPLGLSGGLVDAALAVI